VAGSEKTYRRAWVVDNGIRPLACCEEILLQIEDKGTQPVETQQDFERVISVMSASHTFAGSNGSYISSECMVLQAESCDLIGILFERGHANSMTGFL
jgi:hypothetical protein